MIWNLYELVFLLLFNCFWYLQAGIGAFRKLANGQQRYSTVATMLSELAHSAAADDQDDNEVKVFASKGGDLSSYFYAALKVCRKKLAPTKPALCKVLRSWSASTRATAVMMLCVSEAAQCMDAVPDPADIDLLTSCGLPFFPISQGGPLFYAERLGWEQAGAKIEQLLRKELFLDLPEASQWLCCGEALEKQVSKKFSPVMSEGTVVQTLFPRRPAGLSVSGGLRGLPAPFRRMPWFSSIDAILCFSFYIILLITVLLLTFFWSEIVLSAKSIWS